MSAQKLFISLAILTCLVGAACFAQSEKPGTDPADNSVKITNNLDACVKITPKQMREINGLIWLDTEWQPKSSTGNCGCKSALMNYSVNLSNRNKTGKKIIEAVISSLEKKEYSFLVNADASIKYNGTYEIVINCQNPG